MEYPHSISAELDAFGNMPQITREGLLKMKKERTNAYNITRRPRILTLLIFIGAYANASKNGNIFLHPYKVARHFFLFNERLFNKTCSGSASLISN